MNEWMEEGKIVLISSLYTSNDHAKVLENRMGVRVIQ